MLHRLGSQKAWFGAVVFLALANVIRALFFDWADAGIHGAVAALCVLAALRWPKVAAAVTAAILVLAVSASSVRSSPPEWARVEGGHNWKQVREALGPPTYDAADLAQARRLNIGYAAPSPLRFRHSGAVTIYIRGEYALWVVHDDTLVKATFLGGS